MLEIGNYELGILKTGCFEVRDLNFGNLKIEKLNWNFRNWRLNLNFRNLNFWK